MSVRRSLSAEARALVDVSAALATRKDEVVRAALERSVARAGVVAIEEILLQSHLFLGFPSALNALRQWSEIRPVPEGSGAAGSATPGADPEREDLRLRGESVCRRVYGERYEALRENVRALHPDMERWMIEEGYGKVLGRPGVPLPVRELAVVALLAVLGTPVQLHSHLRGALNVGAGAEQVEEALEAAFRHAGAEERAEARRVWRRVSNRERGE